MSVVVDDHLILAIVVMQILRQGHQRRFSRGQVDQPHTGIRQFVVEGATAPPQASLVQVDIGGISAEQRGDIASHHDQRPVAIRQCPCPVTQSLKGIQARLVGLEVTACLPRGYGGSQVDNLRGDDFPGTRRLLRVRGAR